MEIGSRCSAVQALAKRADQDTVDYLCGLLVVEEEAVLRYEVTRQLVKLRLGGRSWQMPIAQVRRQVDREVANYRRTQHVMRIYRRHHPQAPEADPLAALLRVLAEESVQQIFRLLMLIHRPEDIHLVFEQLQAPDAHLRSDAIELLDNLVDPSMRRALWPILDEDAFLDSMDEAADCRSGGTPQTYAVLQEAIWDHNSWLAVTALCAIGRMRLTALHHELEKAAACTAPVIAAAAKVALDLSEIT